MGVAQVLALPLVDLPALALSAWAVPRHPSASLVWGYCLAAARDFFMHGIAKQLKGVVHQYCLHLCTRNLLACFITQAPGKHV